MKIIKNYIVVEKETTDVFGRNFEARSIELRTLGDCFNTYAEAKEYAMGIREKCEEMSYGEIFYTEPAKPKKGEMPESKKFLVIKEIDTVVCSISTANHYFSVHINNFYDNNMNEMANQRTLMRFLRDNEYINVRGVASERDVIINTAQITFVRL